MDDLDSKLQRLAAKRNIAESEQEAQTKETRAEAWQRILREYPDHAAFLREMADAFGKPERVEMTDLLTGEKIL